MTPVGSRAASLKMFAVIRPKLAKKRVGGFSKQRGHSTASKSTPQLIMAGNQICDVLQIRKPLPGPAYFAPDSLFVFLAHGVVHGLNTGPT